MNQTAVIRPAPVKKTLSVRTTPEKAFRVFTEGFDRWWPRGHHIGKADVAKFVLEPQAGGRWFEEGVDGSQCVWGEVLAWDPPARLVLAWRLNVRWEYDPAAHSEVEVRFTDLGDGTTRVDFEHRGFEGLGEGAQQVRDGVDGPQGWGAIMAGFAQAADAA